MRSLGKAALEQIEAMMAEVVSAEVSRIIPPSFILEISEARGTYDELFWYVYNTRDDLASLEKRCEALEKLARPSP